ncbi:DsbA family oxidoreductase [Dictyobacter arantiisoli]|uniref:DSBA oxidoreductase n=1 Tax=Dictyobacter arantiisoli TaxID=2014874 RepID=A0A5A5T9R8_9CHLR|nr:DsbA family oxidoreductase [Dictyobacter arantiisoli]GCF08077.1 DSBA oxidoreductase [Dictyobacter arantiisoli]
MKIEIWSDIACPWCYIGKRRFESALAQFEHRDQVEIIWRSFELAPDAALKTEGSMEEVVAKKYGLSREQAAESNRTITQLAAKEGLEYHLDQIQMTNTFDAHRLIHLAAHHGLQDVAKERLLKAYFVEARNVGEIDTLVQLASEIGLDAEEARTALSSDTYADAVRTDEERAHVFGITGVPFFAIDEKYGISGAQPTDVFSRALKQSWTESHPLVAFGDVSVGAGTCTDDSCAI